MDSFKTNLKEVLLVLVSYTNLALLPTKLNVHVPYPVIYAFICVLNIVIISNILQNEYELGGIMTLLTTPFISN
jgi:hypothetical protein